MSKVVIALTTHFRSSTAARRREAASPGGDGGVEGAGASTESDEGVGDADSLKELDEGVGRCGGEVTDELTALTSLSSSLGRERASAFGASLLQHPADCGVGGVGGQREGCAFPWMK